MTLSALCAIVSPCQARTKDPPTRRPAEAFVSVDVEFQPLGRRAPCPEGRALLEQAREVGLQLVGLCGGQGTCGRCKVQLLKGRLSPPTAAERVHLTQDELGRAMRLACQACPQTDVSLSVPPGSMSSAQRAQVEGQDVRVSLDPVVRSYDVTVEPPSLQNLSSDTERLRLALTRKASAEVLDFDTEVLRALSPMLRTHEWKLRAYLRAGECIALRPADVQSLGLAFDLGTTKVAGYLLDLDTGETLASKGVMNPQIGYGEDLVARIARALCSADETSRLQRLAIEALGGLAVDLTTQAGGELSLIHI